MWKGNTKLNVSKHEWRTSSSSGWLICHCCSQDVIASIPPSDPTSSSPLITHTSHHPHIRANLNHSSSSCPPLIPCSPALQLSSFYGFFKSVHNKHKAQNDKALFTISHIKHMKHIRLKITSVSWMNYTEKEELENGKKRSLYTLGVMMNRIYSVLTDCGQKVYFTYLLYSV